MLLKKVTAAVHTHSRRAMQAIQSWVDDFFTQSSVNNKLRKTSSIYNFLITLTLNRMSLNDNKTGYYHESIKRLSPVFLLSTCS